MKKRILIPVLVLIIILLIIIPGILKEKNFENIVNNTLNKLNNNEYKYKLKIIEEYDFKGTIVNNKILYIESRKDNLYKISNSIYNNNSLEIKNTYYYNKVSNGYEYYYLDNDAYIKKDVKSISKDINIDLKKLFNNIKSIKKKKNIYYVKTRVSNAFSLMYNNKISSDDYITIKIITNNDLINSISFSLDKEEKYKVSLNIDYNLQNIELPN